MCQSYIRCLIRICNFNNVNLTHFIILNRENHWIDQTLGMEYNPLCLGPGLESLNQSGLQTSIRILAERYVHCVHLIIVHSQYTLSMAYIHKTCRISRVTNHFLKHFKSCINKLLEDSMSAITINHYGYNYDMFRKNNINVIR